MDEIDDKEKYINIIVNQTNYTKEEANELYLKYEGNYIQIIKDYLIEKDKTDYMIESKPTRSLNQEIYKHIRSKMNENMDVVISRMNGNM